ncbi:hypothetical protein [Rubrivivax albus]|uniref:hypothetical protein n=1 Tax=Rubrivivax albus TaxID=2499835 RepID=UPI001E3EB082|nr:hypothetical protein [Rubrivivax albus]
MSGTASFRHASLALACAVSLTSGCATRAVDVRPAIVDPAEFQPWSCDRLQAEMDRVQQRAVELSWIVDERAGQHVVALGVGLMVFWPALLAMRPDGAESDELAALKGRFEALHEAARRNACPPPPAEMAPARAAAMPVLPGERMVYEERATARDPLRALNMTMTTLRRDEIEFVTDAVGVPTRWRQDLAGNVLEAPPGVVIWERLLRPGMALGDVLAGHLQISGDGQTRARVRGQVVAVGPQSIAGRAFDVAVIELYGDAPQGEGSTRLDGAMVVDRGSGLVLRLDLRSAQPLYQLQRRLVRVESAG